MPFNSENAFFKGWYGEGNDDYEGHVYGYVASDASVYRFVSKPFRLPANGIVSVLMAGNGASLHLIDFDGGHGDLAWVDCRTFTSDGDENPIALTGKNTCTMVKHVINFSKYAGRLVQIGIADVADSGKAGGWQAAYFDELRADYTDLPAFHIDVVEQDKDGRTYSAFADKYVCAAEGLGGVDYALDDGPETDESPLYNAYNVWMNYFNNVRNGREGRSFCSVLTDDETKNFLSAYNGLSASQKQIVCASDDFQRVGTGDWWTINPTIYDSEHQYCLASAIEYLAEENSVSVVVYQNGLPVKSAEFGIMAIDNTFIAVAVVSLLIVALTIALVSYLRKKKKQ